VRRCSTPEQPVALTESGRRGWLTIRRKYAPATRWTAPRRCARRIADDAALHLDHASVEEKELLPLTEASLTAADWEEIDATFTGHCDPILGAEAWAEYATLFRGIVDLA